MTAGDISITFENRGDFAATMKAQDYLIARGFSYGPLTPDEPRGILWGRPRIVAKWRCMSDAHRAFLDGQITGDPKSGPIVITIFARAPAAARMAVSQAA